MTTTLAAQLAGQLPADVAGVCATLTQAGHAAVVVGGAVRDALMGRLAADWDVATDAAPATVQRLFPRTIATGLEHGTVTVLAGPKRRCVEVTTFRGEGVYLDARRPSSVTFGVPLREDLARRDITVNAIAFDPATQTLIDPFDGILDIERKVIRAVGDPVARLAEDGLRVMRVVRFAATLHFSIEPATEAALSEALPSLAKVAGERIKSEMWKLLAAPAVAPMLQLMARRGIAQQVAPEWALANVAALAPVLDASEAAMRLDAIERLAILIASASAGDPDRAHAAAIALAMRWRCSIAERQALAAVARGLVESESVSEGLAAASCLARAGRPHVAALMRALRAMGASLPRTRTAHGTMQAGLDAGLALSTKELPLDGADLMALAQRPAGVWVGQTLQALLAWTWEAPAERTNAAALRAHALSMMA
ncbi:MAG: tRNA cytidylyltransferase [Myxococcales bacterium]|nr:tRNA cytidylyltransferase [Myxococcales bacterium]